MTAKKQTTVVHASGKTQDGCAHHAVKISNLKVVLTEEEGIWFAQGLEIDYAAQGASLEEVKTNFEDGLVLTIDANLSEFGELNNFLVPAPADAWQAYWKSNATDQIKLYSQHSVHRFQFEAEIEYVGLAKAA